MGVQTMKHFLWEFLLLQIACVNYVRIKDIFRWLFDGNWVHSWNHRKALTWISIIVLKPFIWLGVCTFDLYFAILHNVLWSVLGLGIPSPILRRGIALVLYKEASRRSNKSNILPLLWICATLNYVWWFQFRKTPFSSQELLMPRGAPRRPGIPENFGQYLVVVTEANPKFPQISPRIST